MEYTGAKVSDQMFVVYDLLRRGPRDAEHIRGRLEEYFGSCTREGVFMLLSRYSRLGFIDVKRIRKPFASAGPATEYEITEKGRAAWLKRRRELKKLILFTRTA